MASSSSFFFADAASEPILGSDTFQNVGVEIKIPSAQASRSEVAAEESIPQLQDLLRRKGADAEILDQRRGVQAEEVGAIDRIRAHRLRRAMDVVAGQELHDQ
jgi:hypothetical protein